MRPVAPDGSAVPAYNRNTRIIISIKDQLIWDLKAANHIDTSLFLWTVTLLITTYQAIQNWCLLVNITDQEWQMIHKRLSVTDGTIKPLNEAHLTWITLS